MNLETALTKLANDTAPIEGPAIARAVLLALRDHPAFIAAIRERRRQIEHHRWTAAHDDKEAPGNLIRAACAFMEHARLQIATGTGSQSVPPVQWPWDAASWKAPLSPEDAMVKAMAMIAAEFDRMQREAKREKEASRALHAESKAP